MGLPFNSFIIATNENDAAVHYYKTGEFKPQETVRTISTAMDVGNPSNFIRVLELFGHDWTKFKEIIKAVRIDTATTIATIKEVRTKYNYLLDPHTAVGFAAAKRIASSNRIPVIIATASPLKFASEIKKTTGIDVDDRRAKRMREILISDARIPEKTIDISSLIMDVYTRIKTWFTTKEKLTFSELVHTDNKEEKIFTFIPLLHLENQRRVDLNQQDHFGEIYINLAGRNFFNID